MRPDHNSRAVKVCSDCAVLIPTITKMNGGGIHENPGQIQFPVSIFVENGDHTCNCLTPLSYAAPQKVILSKSSFCMELVKEKCEQQHAKCT